MPTSLARFLAVLGAVGIAFGIWLAWIDEVAASRIPARRLIGSDMDRETDTFLASIGVLLLAAAIVGAVGALLPSRAPAFVGAVVSIAVIVLLLVQEYDFLPNQLSTSVVGLGVWCSGAGAVVMMIGSLGLHHDVQSELVKP